jgi:glycosyltransferase involved in cell wall biosynthesis
MCTQNDSQPKVLYVETYPTGSHGRILDLLIEHSTLRIETIRCGREHWRWLAIAAQYEIREQLWRRAHDPPHLIICSGPLNVSAFVAMLPPGWDAIPRIVYFHESQWTYPSGEYDPRPFFLAHLDAVALADEAWFNSRYHLETFWSAASSSPAPQRVRDLANRLRPALEPKCNVLYPPVSIATATLENKPAQPARRLLWNARWELDKRPDKFVGMLDSLNADGHNFELLVLGTGNTDTRHITADLGPHVHRTILPGHLKDRPAYEAALSSADIFISTAEHEFFGVSAVEAALSGVVPVLPANLAYPETLPSAYFYDPGDTEDLARIARHLLGRRAGLSAAHRSDAARFVPARTVPVFDEHCLRIIAGRAS